jgi:hypothetical protein
MNQAQALGGEVDSLKQEIPSSEIAEKCACCFLFSVIRASFLVVNNEINQQAVPSGKKLTDKVMI